MLRAVIIDDELFCIESLKKLCNENTELLVVAEFQFADDALEFIKKYNVDIVFTDISMPGLCGLNATRALREINPNIAVIFVTGHEEHAFEAFELEAAAYILKPCSESALKKAVIRAARLISPHLHKNKNVFIQTFDGFCVYVDSMPVVFHNSKAKELLALLVNRHGADVSMELATLTLWEDRPYDDLVKQLYRKAVTHLNSIMRNYDINIFVSARGSCHIVPSEFTCDAYKMLEGDEYTAKKFNGEYLPEYAWAEETTAHLQRYTEKMLANAYLK